jgi:DNA-binding NtrC family response regulator
VPKTKLLCAWIGHNDLRPMAAEQPQEKRQEIMGGIGGETPPAGEIGPIKTLVEGVDFDDICLLSNYPVDWTKRYVKWLGAPAESKQLKPKNPTDYESIFVEVDSVLAGLRNRANWANTELCIHLSPGSPAMTAIWVLLGKSKYPATFYQTYRGKAWITEIPFDLIVDFVPELYRDPDSHLQHLAAQSPHEVAGFEKIIGDSKPIRTAVGLAKRAAVRSVPILLLGESGTGKEMFARAIHDASPRRSGPFHAINCAAISRELLESELFGHVKGAFTGAVRDRAGTFDEAAGGTLFLDEIGECDLELQAKLLRVLQPPPGEGPCCRVFRRVGDSTDRTSDVRVIAATNRDLIRAITEGSFREDLYYRLAVVTIPLPPLRERKSDIPKITESLLDQINQQLSGDPGFRHKSISGATISYVKSHPWPGNVRQLYNALLQAAIMSDGDTIHREHLITATGESANLLRRTGINEHPLGDGFSLDDMLNTVRANYLRRAMEESRGVKAEAARLLGIENYQTLDAQLRRFNITGKWK